VVDASGLKISMLPVQFASEHVCPFVDNTPFAPGNQAEAVGR
jgi:hypothetical protein